MSSEPTELKAGHPPAGKLADRANKIEVYKGWSLQYTELLHIYVSITGHSLRKGWGSQHISPSFITWTCKKSSSKGSSRMLLEDQLSCWTRCPPGHVVLGPAVLPDT